MMKHFVTSITISVTIFILSVAVMSQSAGDNHFHFVTSFNKFVEGDGEGDMTNIKYIGDTDQDGKGEYAFLTTLSDSCHFLIYEATGNDTYDLVFSFPFVPTWNASFRDWTGIVAGDLNGNGLVEIIVGLPVEMRETILYPNPPRLVVFEWNGVVGENMYGYDNGTAPSSYWNFDVPDNFSLVPFQLAIDDIDNDGTLELIADFREPKALYVISQTDSWDFPGWTVEWYITNAAGDPRYVSHFDGGGYYGSGFGDLDGDGKKEIYAPVWNQWSLNIYECQEPGNFTREVYIKQARKDADYGAIRGVVLGDVNKDGVKELYYVGSDMDANRLGHVFVISNVTDLSQVTAASIVDLLTFPMHPLNTTTRAARTALLTDIDQDGNPDIMICGSSNGQVYDFEYMGGTSGDPMVAANWTFTIAFDLYEHWKTYLPDTTVDKMSPRFWDGDVCKDMDGDGHHEFIVINYGTDRNIVPDDPWYYIFEEGPATSVNQPQISEVPGTFVLLQNYPNPFNPFTTIRYRIPEAAHVSIRIFDTLGQEVRTLYDAIASPGEGTVVWDGMDAHGREVSSGIYSYQLKTPHHQYTRTMTFLK